jgi:PPIC-type PPIASE domain.
MAVLEKIRVKFGILITVLVALALLSFIIDPSTLRNAAQMLSADNEVGKMDGKSISYKEFYEELDKVTKIAEIMGQKANDEQGQQQLRDAAWQSIFDKEVFEPKAEKAGIAVGDQEMLDLTQGSNISPVLLQQGMFLDQNGNFSREALVQFVQSLSADETGVANRYWDFLEDNIYKSQLYNKYASLLQNSNVLSSVESQHMILDNNVTSDVDFVLVPVGFGQDSTITVSDQEIKDYYNARKKQMKQLANRDIEYVMFEVVPSQEDIDNTREAFEELYAEFKEADALKNFVMLNSDKKWDTYYYTAEQLESVPEFREAAFGGSGISEIHEEDGSYSAARVADRQMMPDSVRVFYTAFPVNLEEKADSLVKVANVAKVMPSEFNELGWLTQELAAANGLDDFMPAFSAPGKAVKVKSKSANALLVLYVAEKTKPVQKVQLATIVKNVMASDETYRDFLIKATELADKSDGKYENFAAVVKEENLPVIPVPNILESTRRIGVCENARELVHWVFDKKTKKGDVSDVIVVDNKYYFVAAVTNTRKEGQMSVAEVANDIRSALTAEKKITKLAGEVAEKIKGCTTMEQVAEALQTTVSHKDGVTFGSQQTQLDPKFVGAVAGADQGVITGPVEGNIGVFVFQVADRQSGSFFTEEDARTYAGRVGSYQTNVMSSVFAEEADIKDNRSRFF